MYLGQIIEHSGVSESSRATWRRLRPLFGEFREAICGGAYDPDSARRYTIRSPVVGEDEQYPELVLVDEEESELWLSGCTVGYTGEGPTNTAYILLSEGFPADQVNLVGTCQFLHLVKSRRDPVRAIPSGDRGYTVPLEQHIAELVADGYFNLPD